MPKIPFLLFPGKEKNKAMKQLKSDPQLNRILKDYKGGKYEAFTITKGSVADIVVNKNAPKIQSSKSLFKKLIRQI